MLISVLLPHPINLFPPHPSLVPSDTCSAVLAGEPGDNTDTRGPATEVSQSQHVLICALQELGSLVKALTTCAMPLVSEPTLSKHSLLYNVLSLINIPCGEMFQNSYLVIVC